MPDRSQCGCWKMDHDLKGRNGKPISQIREYPGFLFRDAGIRDGADTGSTIDESAIVESTTRRSENSEARQCAALQNDTRGKAGPACAVQRSRFYLCHG